MGLIEKWNSFAKKKIHINDDFEIGCGKLVFTGIIVLLEALPIFIMTGNWAAALVTLATFLTALKQKKDD